MVMGTGKEIFVTGEGNCVKHFDRIMPYVRLRIYVKVFVIHFVPQISSKSIDIWL
jgi:hypothetical protein